MLAVVPAVSPSRLNGVDTVTVDDDEPDTVALTMVETWVVTLVTP